MFRNIAIAKRVLGHAKFAQLADKIDGLEDLLPAAPTLEDIAKAAAFSSVASRLNRQAIQDGVDAYTRVMDLQKK